MCIATGPDPRPVQNQTSAIKSVSNARANVPAPWTQLVAWGLLATAPEFSPKTRDLVTNVRGKHIENVFEKLTNNDLQNLDGAPIKNVVLSFKRQVKKTLCTYPI